MFLIQKLKASLEALEEKKKVFTNSHGKWYMLLGQKSHNSDNLFRQRMINAEIFVVLLNAYNIFPVVNG